MAEENISAESVQPAQVVQAAEASVYYKASVGKRILAVLIDMVVMIPVWLVFHYIHLAFVGGLLTMAYAFLKDGINFAGLDNRSIGKKTMGLRVVNLSTGQRCSYVDSLLRQIMFIVPILNILLVIIEFIIVLINDKGIRLGDQIAKTMVIEEA